MDSDIEAYLNRIQNKSRKLQCRKTRNPEDSNSEPGSERSDPSSAFLSDLNIEDKLRQVSRCQRQKSDKKSFQGGTIKALREKYSRRETSSSRGAPEPPLLSGSGAPEAPLLSGRVIKDKRITDAEDDSEISEGLAKFLQETSVSEVESRSRRDSDGRDSSAGSLLNLECVKGISDMDSDGKDAGSGESYSSSDDGVKQLNLRILSSGRPVGKPEGDEEDTKVDEETQAREKEGERQEQGNKEEREVVEEEEEEEEEEESIVEWILDENVRESRESSRSLGNADRTSSNDPTSEGGVDVSRRGDAVGPDSPCGKVEKESGGGRGGDERHGSGKERKSDDNDNGSKRGRRKHKKKNGKKTSASNTGSSSSSSSESEISPEIGRKKEKTEKRSSKYKHSFQDDVGFQTLQQLQREMALFSSLILPLRRSAEMIESSYNIRRIEDAMRYSVDLTKQFMDTHRSLHHSYLSTLASSYQYTSLLTTEKIIQSKTATGLPLTSDLKVKGKRKTKRLH